MISRAGIGVIGLGLAVILSAPVSAHADSDRCGKYAHVRPNQRAVLSSTPSKICSMEIVGVGQAVAIDSPDGTSTHGQARNTAEAANGTVGSGASTGKIDRFTEFGLTIESNEVNVFISWE